MMKDNKKTAFGTIKESKALVIQLTFSASKMRMGLIPIGVS